MITTEKAALYAPAAEAGGDDEGDTLLQPAPKRYTSLSWCSRYKFSIAAYTFLACVIALQTLFIIRLQSENNSRPPRLSKLGLRIEEVHTRTIGLRNAFYNGSALDPQNAAWDGIGGGGHGIVALTPEFVAARGLPDTMAHPYDPSKRVYALESYHMIHCLERIRKDYLALRRGEEPGKPLEHDLHCFDALRQSIMCHASDELIIITGEGHAKGYNQTIQCRDWDALRDFATEHTACYSDEPPAWDQCDDGSDGLPIGSLLGQTG